MGLLYIFIVSLKKNYYVLFVHLFVKLNAEAIFSVFLACARAKRSFKTNIILAI